MENKRIGNLELRKTKHWLKDENDKDAYYWEIVQWQPNPDYGKRSEFKYDEQNKMYYNPKNPFIYKSESCFTNPEYCYTILGFKTHNDEEPDILSVGSRPINISDDEFLNLKQLLVYFYENWYDENK